MVTVSVVVAAPIAFAAVWNDTCNSGELCVFKNGGFTVPKAATTDSDSYYTNNNYPNTVDTLNDSVSSVKNKFVTKDVIWYWDSSYRTNPFCVPAGYIAGSLGSANDEFSSHIVASGGTC